jgi:hypothetical protein
MIKELRLRKSYRDVKTGQFATDRDRHSAPESAVQEMAGRLLDKKDSRAGRGTEAVYRVAASRKIRRVQEAFKKARKGEGLFGLRDDAK